MNARFPFPLSKFCVLPCTILRWKSLKPGNCCDAEFVVAVGEPWSRWRRHGRRHGGSQFLSSKYSALLISRCVSFVKNSDGTPHGSPEGRGVGCLFWVLSHSLSEISLSSFSCCFLYHVTFDGDISIVYGIHILLFCTQVDSSISYAPLSTLTPETNYIQFVNHIMYFCWENKTLELEVHWQ